MMAFAPIRLHDRRLPPLLGYLVWATAPLAKGASHKYIRRVPTGKLTPKGKPIYRYYYSVGGGSGLGHHEEMVEGSAFAVKHAGKAGHFHVTKVDGEHVHIRHDESGHEERVHKDALRELLHQEHAERIEKRGARIARDLEHAQKNQASPKALESLRAEQRRHQATFGGAKPKSPHEQAGELQSENDKKATASALEGLHPDADLGHKETALTENQKHAVELRDAINTWREAVIGKFYNIDFDSRFPNVGKPNGLERFFDEMLRYEQAQSFNNPPYRPTFTEEALARNITPRGKRPTKLDAERAKNVARMAWQEAVNAVPKPDMMWKTRFTEDSYGDELQKLNRSQDEAKDRTYVAFTQGKPTHPVVSSMVHNTVRSAAPGELGTARGLAAKVLQRDPSYLVDKLVQSHKQDFLRFSEYDDAAPKLGYKDVARLVETAAPIANAEQFTASARDKLRALEGEAKNSIDQAAQRNARALAQRQARIAQIVAHDANIAQLGKDLAHLRRIAGTAPDADRWGNVDKHRQELRAKLADELELRDKLQATVLPEPREVVAAALKDADETGHPVHDAMLRAMRELHASGKVDPQHFAGVQALSSRPDNRHKLGKGEKVTRPGKKGKEIEGTKHGQWVIAREDGGHTVTHAPSNAQVAKFESKQAAEHLVGSWTDAPTMNTLDELKANIERLRPAHDDARELDKLHGQGLAPWQFRQAEKDQQNHAEAVRELDEHLAKPVKPFTPSPKVHDQAKAVARALKFASKDESRANLMQVLVHNGKAVATDGHRLVMVPTQGGESERHYDHNGNATTNPGGFPAYTKVIPEVNDAEVVEMSAPALKALADHHRRLVVQSAKDQNPSKNKKLMDGLELDFKAGQLHAKAADGRTHSSIGGNGKLSHGLAVNAVYLSQALEGHKGTVRIHHADINDGYSPIYLEHENGEKHIIMPMRR